MITSASSLVSFTGRRAVVTGGAQGIGKAVGLRLAEAGASVVLTDISERVVDAAAELGEQGYDVAGRVMDVTDSAQHEALAQELVSDHGRLDVWVNNAGVFPADDALDIDDDLWRTVFAVNADGTFYGCRAAGRAMKKQGSGVIVNLVSVSAFRVSGDGRAHYASSKGAVRSMTQAFARELGRHGVRVVGVAPTATLTEGLLGLADEHGRAAGGADDMWAQYAATLPLRRVPYPDDIARVVLFAASDLAGFVTGSTIAADGGQMSV